MLYACDWYDSQVLHAMKTFNSVFGTFTATKLFMLTAFYVVSEKIILKFCIRYKFDTDSLSIL